MKGRTTIQLGVLAAILASGLYLLDEHLDRRQAASVRVKRVFDVTVEPVTAIGFERDGVHVDLVRKGDLWFLQSPMRARANAPLVESLVSELEKLRRRDRITSEHREQHGLTLADYGLEPARMMIRLETGGGRIETLGLGDLAPFGGAVYAKIGRSEAVFTLPESVRALFPDDLSALRDRTVVHGRPETTERIDIHRRDAGFVQLVRQKSGWVLQQPLEARADDAAVRQLLDAVFAMRVESFLWDAETDDTENDESAARMEMARRGQIEAGDLAEDAARLRLAIWTEDDRLGQEIFIGRDAGEHGEGHVYARKGGVDAVYTIPASILEACAVPVDALRDRAVFRMAAGEIGYIRLQHGENRVELQRLATGTTPGGTWRLLTPARAPAESEAVNALMARLLGLRVADYLPATAADEHRTAGADATLLSIALAQAAPAGPDAEGTARENVIPPQELLLEGDPMDGTARRARTTAGKEWFTLDSAAAKGLDETIVSPLPFRDRLVLAINTGTVFRIQRVTATGTVRVEREAGPLAPEWRCREEEGDSRPANPAAVEDLLMVATNIEAGRFVAFMPPDLAPYGLDAPAAALTFGFRDTERIQNTLLLGAAADESWRYAMVQGQDFVFLLAAPAVTRLLQPLCTPTPAETTPAATPGTSVPAADNAAAGEK
jgi:hypothetical protein